MIKFIVSDVDGTLVFDQERPNILSDKIISLIKECHKRGILFAVASGRHYSNLKKLFLPVWEDIYFLAENGNSMYYKDKVVRSMSIPTPVVKMIIEQIENHPNMGVGFSTDAKILTFKEPDWFSKMLVYGLQSATQIIDDINQVYAEDVVKVSAYTPIESVDSVWAAYKNELGDLLRVENSGSGWLDFSLSGKGAATRYLMHTYGFSKDEVMVFGDNYNDIEMFSAVNNSFAMTGADDAVKEKAKYQTDSVEDVIEKYLETSSIV